ncbi:MAG: hypothetical protein GTN39_06330, partial [Candidatus Aenigmarchaeota archaeon]|nr:hypothetical protein [Candidatus Aenigmarchaeota archaeon]
RGEYRALEYIYDEPADLSEIHEKAEMKYRECEKFLKRMIRLKYVQENAETPDIKPPERVELNPKLFERFPLPFLSAPASVDVFITSRC